MSNGGMMAYRLACEASAHFTSLVSVSGTYMLQRPCTIAKPTNFLHLHGDDDPTVPWTGGLCCNLSLPGMPGLSVPDSLEHLARQFKCRCSNLTCAQQHRGQGQEQGGASSGEARGVSKWSFDGCLNGVLLEVCLLPDWKHHWPARIGKIKSPLQATKFMLDWWAGIVKRDKATTALVSNQELSGRP